MAERVKNPVREHGASSIEKANSFWGLIAPQDHMAIHPRSGERGILAFSRNRTLLDPDRKPRNEKSKTSITKSRNVKSTKKPRDPVLKCLRDLNLFLSKMTAHVNKEEL